MNVDGGCEEPEGGDGDAEDGHEAVTQPRGQGGHQGAAAKCQEDEEGAGKSGLRPANTEPLAYPGQKEAKGVGGSLLDQGDHEGGRHHQPRRAASIWPPGGLRLVIDSG